MNQNSTLKIVLLGFILCLSLLYSLPNMFGDDPAVQISTTDRITLSSDELAHKVKSILQDLTIEPIAIETNDQAVILRFGDTNTQIEARDRIKASLGRDYIAALNLAPRTPSWLAALGAKPMKLGLDLRGGVHFLLGVDTDTLLKSRQKADLAELKKRMREDNIRYQSVRDYAENGFVVMLRDESVPLQKIQGYFQDYQFEPGSIEGEWHVTLRDTARTDLVSYAVNQTIQILTNRVNELGVSEAIVQRQGKDKITVDLPGIQDMSRAKELIGKTASLRFQLEDDQHDAYEAQKTGVIPVGSQLLVDEGRPVLLKNQVILQGDAVTYAMMMPDEHGMPSVNIRLGGANASLFHKTTADNIHKRLAVVYVEPLSETIIINGEPQVIKKQSQRIISLATIQSALGNNFNITGLQSQAYAKNLALLLRSGAMVTPVDFLQERLVGPSLGQANIDKGVMSLAVGSLLVILFMALYYRGFGMIANVALMLNIFLIVSILSLIGATLTLAGIAGIVLTIGMAVDANVLINERIREELSLGSGPQMSIQRGYEKAFATIVDANITTLIVAMVLFALGSAAVKGFAVTLTIGILASMLTSIVFTRAIVNAWYGGKSSVVLSIGKVVDRPSFERIK